MVLGATFQQSITLSYLNCPSAKEKAVGLLYAIYTLYAVFTPEIAFINVNARYLLWVEKVALLFLSKRYDAPPHKKTFLLHSIRSIEAVFGTSDFIKLLGANSTFRLNKLECVENLSSILKKVFALSVINRKLKHLPKATSLPYEK